jgi:hypothetical protein
MSFYSEEYVVRVSVTVFVRVSVTVFVTVSVTVFVTVFVRISLKNLFKSMFLQFLL